jgi:hypothetical protein
MSKEVIKLSAAVPLGWKLNRRLFNKAMQPYLKPTKWIPSSDGRLPYFPWWVNAPFHALTWSTRKILQLITQDEANQGSWADWGLVSKSRRWANEVSKCTRAITASPIGITKPFLKETLSKRNLRTVEQINLFQVCYSLGRERIGADE